LFELQQFVAAAAANHRGTAIDDGPSAGHDRRLHEWAAAAVLNPLEPNPAGAAWNSYRR